MITYDDLLQLFWSGHDPTRPSYSRQYESLVLAHDGEQLARANQSRNRLESLLGRPVFTRIERLDRFYLAEAYHQKYRLRNAPLVLKDFQAAYPREADLMNSTAAARVNGYLDGAGSCIELERDAAEFGLTPGAIAFLQTRCR